MAILDNLDQLMTSISELAKEAATVEARLEESRLIPERIVSKFAHVLAERDAQFEDFRKRLDEQAREDREDRAREAREDIARASGVLQRGQSKQHVG